MLVLGSQTHRVSIPSSGKVRLDSKYKTVEHIRVSDDVLIPLLELANGDTTPLPEVKADTLYVVSGIVAGRVRRPDILAPARLTRENGKVTYARALLRYGNKP
jgi:hypothetical protein